MHAASRIASALVMATLVAAPFTPAPAATPRSARPPEAPHENSAFAPERLAVQRVTLGNGLTVLLHEDHAVPTIAFWQWYRVGSRDERPGITGISHFFEHMMFNGSKNVAPKMYDKILESNGGYSNAFTSNDMTAYYEEIASDRVGVVLRLDSDRMAALSLLPEQMKSEIEVVKEERRLRTDNDIQGMLSEQLYATAFNASPYHWPVIGWMGDLNRITREDMQEYFRIHYAPDNCILVLTGDFDSKAALDSIRAYFGPIPRQPAPPAPVNSEPEQRGERRVDVHYPAQDVSFQVGYKAPGVKGEDVYVCDVLASILGEGESSRLHQALVYRRQIALYAGAGFQTHIEPGLFEIYAEMKPGHTASEGLAAMDSVIQGMIEKGPGERELQKARNLLEAGFIKRLKTNNGVGEQIGFFEHVFGDYRAMFTALDRYHSVTAEDCRRVAKQMFDPGRRTVAVLVPEKPGGQEARP
ncbi:MAG: insulinase family protein [Candidatus Eisenbacteria bacterium]|nr:insulinase family protein [Candidatus Eisenbacteria bacterium]